MWVKSDLTLSERSSLSNHTWILPIVAAYDIVFTLIVLCGIHWEFDVGGPDAQENADVMVEVEAALHRRPLVRLRNAAKHVIRCQSQVRAEIGRIDLSFRGVHTQAEQCNREDRNSRSSCIAASHAQTRICLIELLGLSYGKTL